MLDPHDEPIRAILHRAVLTYLTVTHDGLRLLGEPLPVHQATARILSFGGARTLYRQKRPVCRSLDGVQALRSRRACADCDDRPRCTPQIRVDLIIGTRAYRCLLAFTSATNFLEYQARLRQAGQRLHAVDTVIEVIDRATWGELRFRAKPVETS